MKQSGKVAQPSEKKDFKKVKDLIMRFEGPRVDATVDMAIISFSKNTIILGRKKDDPANKWRFPGGFSDPIDDNFLESARRELSEEVLGLSYKSDLFSYGGSFKIPDSRYVCSVDAVITSLFIYDLDGDYHGGKADLTAGDDLAEVREFHFSELLEHIMPHHREMAKVVFNLILINHTD